jgi:hypothetical protein
VQEWHDAVDTVVRENARTVLKEESLKDRRWEEMSAETGKHQGNKDRRLEEAKISEEREDTWENLRENHRAGDREANLRIFWPVTKYQGLDIMVGSPPRNEEPTRNFRVRGTGNVGAPATLDSFGLPVGKRRKTLDDGDTRGWAGTLRREQWESFEKKYSR